MASMEMALEKPIAELIPQAIKWNNAELMAGVKEELKKYQEIKYDDSNITDAKTAKANLNNFSKSLNQARLTIEKEYKKPIDDFKTQVNEVINEVDSVSAQIGEVVNEYDRKCKEKKQAEIQSIYETYFGALMSYIPLEKIQDSRWLNATYKTSQIVKEMRDLAEKINKDLQVIDGLANAATIRVFYLRELDLTNALAEDKRLTDEKKRAEELRAQRELEAATKKEVEQQQTKAEILQPKAEPQQEPEKTKEEKLYELSFKVAATISQLNALKKFFIETKINYEKI